MSDACMARKRCLHGVRATLARLAGVAGNVLWDLLVIFDSFSFTLPAVLFVVLSDRLVTSANYLLYAAEVDSYSRQVALYGVKDGYADCTDGADSHG